MNEELYYKDIHYRYIRNYTSQIQQTIIYVFFINKQGYPQRMRLS